MSRVPPVSLEGFHVPTAAQAVGESSTAIVAAAPHAAPHTLTARDPSAAWDAGIDEEVEALLRNEIGNPTLHVAPVPPPPRQPRLTSALLFKVAGGVSGATGKALVRAKEVERRLTIARAAYSKGKRDDRSRAQEDARTGPCVRGARCSLLWTGGQWLSRTVRISSSS